MALTGHAEGPPLLVRQDYLQRVDQLLERLGSASAQVGHRVQADVSLLGERAALARLTRRGRVSAGGKSRLLRVADGHIALTLAREEDLELLPAWLGCEVADDPWDDVARAVRALPADTLVHDGQGLGLPVAAVRSGGAPAAAPFSVVAMRSDERGSGVPLTRRPLVLDFSSLWAGPLCAHLLGRAGARVIKVESLSRPDGARRGNAAFYDLLHEGHESLALDFGNPADLDRLRRLMVQADFIIEASRPRAFEQLGLSPARFFAAKPTLTWISITAYGRTEPQANRVGFGDDVAAGAGLLALDASGEPCFIGDALADPLAGICAAIGGLEAWLEGGGRLVDASLMAAASYVAAAGLPHGDSQPAVVAAENGSWALKCGTTTEPVRPPKARMPQAAAATCGAHTGALLGEFLP